MTGRGNWWASSRPTRPSCSNPQKGSRKPDRKPRKRGGRAALRGIAGYLDFILVARDRSGQTIDAVTGRGAPAKSRLVEHLLPRLDPQAPMVTDTNAACRASARDHGSAHQAVNLASDERVRASSRGAIHVQNVNAHYRRFKEMAGTVSRRGVMAPHTLPGLVLGT